MSSHHAQLGHSTGQPTARDIAFLGLLVLVLASVAAMGAVTFREGLKTEATKAQGEAFVAWLSQSKAHRTSPSFSPMACAQTSPAEGIKPPAWRDCAGALLAAGGPLADVRNSFSQAPIGLIARCDPASRTSPGQLVIERISTTPPGSAVPLLVAPVAPDDAMNQPLTLRVTVCDKGGYGVKIGEAEF